MRPQPLWTNINCSITYRLAKKYKYKEDKKNHGFQLAITLNAKNLHPRLRDMRLYPVYANFKNRKTTLIDVLSRRYKSNSNK